MQVPAEDEHLEFKAARSGFSKQQLGPYFSAFANEGGGRLILGVTDARPRKVVGTQAFGDLGELKGYLRDEFGPLLEIEEINHPGGRVLVFHVSGRPLGRPIVFRGAAWKRVGESLVPMTEDELRLVFQEGTPDFSAAICSGADMSDLSPAAIEALRAVWLEKSGNKRLASLKPAQLLADAGLMIGGLLTNAAVLLLGTDEAMRRLIPQAEIIFEFRAQEGSIPFQQRREFREGFLLYRDRLWDVIDAHNDIYHFQEGFFVGDVPTFTERVVREGILNAFSHRDYRSQKSIFVRQHPQRLEIVSPGGFPPGITAENILWRQEPRNRLLCEVLAKCGLVERSGQGVDLMFDTCIREGKARPDFSGTDAYEVHLTLRGEVRDESFLRFLGHVAREKQILFATEDLLVLDLINSEKPIPPELRDRLPGLLESGVVERQGPRRFLLSRRYYQFIGKPGTYTRKRGLDRETQKALLLKHLEDSRAEGSRLQELNDVLPFASRRQVQKMLGELQTEGKAHHLGQTRAARWYVGSAPDGEV
jgi:ATP-dependent DNA helicase RecG